MDFVDLILNLAGLLLWLNWRAERLDAAYRVPVISLAHAVRKAGSSRFQKWGALPLLGGLVAFRALFYWYFAEQLPHTFKLDLIAVELPFSTARFWLTQLYSLLSLLFTLGFFYLALLLFSIVNERAGEKETPHRFVRIHLGGVDRLPLAARALLPGLVGLAGWMIGAHALAGCGILPTPRSFAELWQRGIVIGLGVYLHWRWVILAVLFLHMVNTYVYLGRQTTWSYIQTTGRKLLAPLQVLPVRTRKVDFTPLVAMAIVSALAVLLESGWELPGNWDRADGSHLPTQSIPPFAGGSPADARGTAPRGIVERGVLPWLYEHAPF